MNNSVGNSHSAKERVRLKLAARYRAERRFQFYGKLAIGLGLLFLSMLFFSILSKGLPAFQQSYMELEVNFERNYVDPQGDGSLESLAAGDYGGLVKQTLRKRFPDVKNRREKRALYSIVSTGAAYQLRDMVMSNPELVGNTVRVWVPADDELDMLLKGHTTDMDRHEGSGMASLVNGKGEIRLLSTSNDFTNILQDIKRIIAKSAKQSERKLKSLQANLADAEMSLLRVEERILEAKNEAQQNAVRIQVLEEKLADVKASIDNYKEGIAQEEVISTDLRQRAESPGGVEQLNSEMPSYLAFVNEGLVKLTRVSNTEATGKVLTQLKSMDEAKAGEWEILEFETPETARRLKDNALAWAWDLK